jgi:hypothetical protein
MLTRDEVLQLILYLLVASVLLLASRARAEPGKMAADSHAGQIRALLQSEVSGVRKEKKHDAWQWHKAHRDLVG